ncbi:Uncharacterised protein [Neisseria gonorrhoeae]|uniref:Uncharacterized protein n=1 Tax=Neisseria gonorrhoeae TaxID=485 RepID=A0A378W0C9_NEIGO|nr:Uncharacterised protein [Neisseria gonorrhoeae]
MADALRDGLTLPATGCVVSDFAGWILLPGISALAGRYRREGIGICGAPFKPGRYFPIFREFVGFNKLKDIFCISDRMLILKRDKL